MTGADPLGSAEFATILAAALSPSMTGLVAAVSGGADSICLMHLLAGWRDRGGSLPIVVATVDHGLRSDSGVDARFVMDEAEALGLPAHELRWEGPKPERGLQEKARVARYRLLTTLCGRLDATCLLTAHTLDDQAETVLFRLARGSGLSGLAGMGRRGSRGDVVHLRPLLDIPKARLVATCLNNDWAYREDPSNHNPRFARTRLRTMMPRLADEGLDARCLARLAERAHRAEQALQHTADAAAHLAATAGPGGAACLDGATLITFPAEIVLRVLGATIVRVAEGDAPPRLQRLEALATAVTDAVRRRIGLRRTLNGTILTLDRRGQITIRREGVRRRGRRVESDARLPSSDPPIRSGNVPRSGSLGNGGTGAYIGG